MFCSCDSVITISFLGHNNYCCLFLCGIIGSVFLFENCRSFLQSLRGPVDWICISFCLACCLWLSVSSFLCPFWGHYLGYDSLFWHWNLESWVSLVLCIVGLVCSLTSVGNCTVALQTIGRTIWFLDVVTSFLPEDSMCLFRPFFYLCRLLVMLGACCWCCYHASCLLCSLSFSLLLLWAFVGTLGLSGGLVMFCEVLPPDFSFVLTDVDGCK